MLELFYNFILKPKHNLYGILEKKPYGLILAILVFYQLSSYISDLLGSPSPDNLKVTLLGGFLSHLVSYVTLLVICSVVIHLSARFLGGYEHGKFRILLTAFGLSLFPSILKTPFQLLFGAFGEYTLILISISKLILIIWIIYLQVMAVRSIYLISTERSIIAYISPVLAFSFIILLVGLSTFVMILFIFKGLFSIFI